MPSTFRSRQKNPALVLFVWTMATLGGVRFYRQRLLQSVTCQAKLLTAHLLAIQSSCCFTCSVFTHQLLGNDKKTRFCVGKGYGSATNQSHSRRYIGMKIWNVIITWQNEVFRKTEKSIISASFTIYVS